MNNIKKMVIKNIWPEFSDEVNTLYNAVSVDVTTNARRKVRPMRSSINDAIGKVYNVLNRL